MRLLPSATREPANQDTLAKSANPAVSRMVEITQWAASAQVLDLLPEKAGI